MNDKKVYTHDEATRILDMFDDVLSHYDIHVPSPEDDEREPDNMVGLYGSTYSELLDEVEELIIKIIEAAREATVIKYEFSGTY